MRRLFLLCVMLCAGPGLPGCGQSGALYLPDPPADPVEAGDGSRSKPDNERDRD